MSKQDLKKNQKSMEETLWDSANKMRGTVESSEYKHVVLGLIFLKHVSFSFEAKHAELLKGRGEAVAEDRDRYRAERISSAFRSPRAGLTYRRTRSRRTSARSSTTPWAR